MAEVNEDFEEYNKKQLENMLENRMLVPNGYLRVHYLATEVNEKRCYFYRVMDSGLL